MRTNGFLWALLLATTTGAAFAQDHSMPGMDPTKPVDAYRAAMETMMSAMDVEPSGDPDVDFARGMVAHHEGAIEMAQVLIEQGRDPELRALALAIVAAQEAEVAFLTHWLETNDAR